MAHPADVNADGMTDLMLHVNTAEMQLAPDQTEVWLYGATRAGVPIRGRDRVRVVGGSAPGLAVRPRLDRGAASGARLVAVVSSTEEGPARLELLDVTGRRLASQDLGMLPAGDSELAVATKLRLRAGVYLLRVTREGLAATAKAVVLP